MACLDHKDHENRIERLEGEMKDVQSSISRQTLIAVVLGFFGTVFTGTAAFAGVVFAPMIKVWLGIH